MRDYMRAIVTAVIVHPQPALMGLARLAGAPEKT
jgi:glucokinase